MPDWPVPHRVAEPAEGAPWAWLLALVLTLAAMIGLVAVAHLLAALGGSAGVPG